MAAKRTVPRLSLVRRILALAVLGGFLPLFAGGPLAALAPGLDAPAACLLAKVQFTPALSACLAGAFGGAAVLAGLVVLTLLFGRVYCSVLCPLGLAQDCLIRLLPKSRRRFRHRPGRPALRAAALLVFAAALVFGSPLIVGIFDPYSAFGRMAADLLSPLMRGLVNAVAWAAELRGRAAPPVVPTAAAMRTAGLGASGLALLTLLVVGGLTLRGGRIWCDLFCPVGAALGVPGRFARFRPRIDGTRCVRCGRCERACKTGCVDAKRGVVEASRCISCGNCPDVCAHDALRFAPDGPPAGGDAPQAGRRAFLAALSALFTLPVLPVAAGARNLNEVVPALTRQRPFARKTPLAPPGSGGLDAFRARCTGCQLCVAVCPGRVLRPADRGVALLQPVLGFEYGYCRENCARCSEVCPTGAIRPLALKRKAALQIGRAVVDDAACIAGADRMPCRACARNCPTGAISLPGEDLRDPDHPRPGRPRVDPERCTGCGACEYHCPARPFAAIHVEGLLRHREI